MRQHLNFVMVLLISFSLIGCKITPYRHVLRTDAGEEIGMRCALMNKIPVMCAFFVEKEVRVPVEVLVEVVVEKVVEVEKIVEVEKVVEIEKIVEIFVTEYVDRDIDIDVFVQRVIAALPPGTTRDNYDYTEVVSTVKETLVTYTPEPESTALVKPGTNERSPEPESTTIVKTVIDNPLTNPIVPQTPPNVPRSSVPPPQSPPVEDVPDPEVALSSDGDADGEIRVHGGTATSLDNPNKNLEIRTGAHDPYVCEDELDVMAYGVGTDEARGHQHWSACKVGDDIVVHLQDHPALTCNVGPNMHELEIEGVTERVTVGEECE